MVLFIFQRSFFRHQDNRFNIPSCQMDSTRLCTWYFLSTVSLFSTVSLQCGTWVVVLLSCSPQPVSLFHHTTSSLRFLTGWRIKSIKAKFIQSDIDFYKFFLILFRSHQYSTSICLFKTLSGKLLLLSPDCGTSSDAKDTHMAISLTFSFFEQDFPHCICRWNTCQNEVFIVWLAETCSIGRHCCFAWD